MTGTPYCSGRHWHSARLVPGCLPCRPSADKAQGPLNSGRRRCRRGQRAPAPADAQAATPHWEPKLQPVADAGADTGSRARPPEGQRSGRQTLGAVMAKAPLRRPRWPVPRKSAGAEERTVRARACPGTAWGRPAAWGRRPSTQPGGRTAVLCWRPWLPQPFCKEKGCGTTTVRHSRRC